MKINAFKSFKTSSKALTIAEVLITLVLLGIISACVLPAVKINVQEKTMVTKLRRSYTLLNNSFQSAVAKYGSPKYWGLTPGRLDVDTNVAVFEDNEKFFHRLFEGLKYEYVKNTLPPQPTNYLNNEDYAIINPDGFERQPLFRLNDGTTVFHSWYNSGGCKSWSINACGDFAIDINGADAPNVLGIDQFEFFYTESAIIPIGYPNHINGKDIRTAETHCNPKEKILRNGYGCAAWVIEKGTMPWLKGIQPKW